MRWVSSRGASPAVPFIDALFAGTAPDGGLYMPERLDPLSSDQLAAIRAAAGDIVEIGTIVGSHLLRDEISVMDMRALVRDALDFPIPLVPVTDNVWSLELFHGPTMAFKDVGARTQARLLHHFTDGTPLTILVATSGDTGSAVAQAFHGVPDTRVVVLYPEGKVTDVQEAQMASLGDNIIAVAVHGTFDDCQRLVKQAFADDDLRSHVWLTPANSINLGRLLPQVFYYFVLAGLGPASGFAPGASADKKAGPYKAPVVSVPSGNFGNLTAGLIAKRIGLPVERFVAATNVNDVVPEYLRTGDYRPRASVKTVANAMDVGAPSNFERMRAMYGESFEALRCDIAGAAFNDETVVAEIRAMWSQHRYLLDPHGAIAWLGLRETLAIGSGDSPGVFLATAHPAKFREVVEPAIGQAIPLPPALAEAIKRPRHSERLPVDYGVLKKLLLAQLR
jgi:threonine synthase